MFFLLAHLWSCDGKQSSGLLHVNFCVQQVSFCVALKFSVSRIQNELDCSSIISIRYIELCEHSGTLRLFRAFYLYRLDQNKS